MRLKRLELSGFRGFSRPASFDLDSDVVIVEGANGRGKTSLFDAILWAITGKVARLGDDATLISHYSDTGDARVSLTFVDANTVEYQIVRTCDGSGTKCRFVGLQGEAIGEHANLEVLRLLWPEALLTSDASGAFTSAFVRCIYLQQDRVRDFVESDDEEERFTAVSELVGVGRVTELQSTLSNARTAWTRATNQKKEERDRQATRVKQLEEQLQRLTGGNEISADQLTAAWSGWWSDFREAGIPIPPNSAAASQPNSTELTRGLRDLEVQRLQSEERNRKAKQILKEFSEQPAPPVEEPGALSEQVTELRKEVDVATLRLKDKELKAAEVRLKLIEDKEQSLQMKSLAEIALRHLGETCPVCDQAYDKESVTARLSSIVGASNAPNNAMSASDEVTQAASVLADTEKKLANVDERLRKARSAETRRETWRVELKRKCDELKLVSDQESVATLAAQLIVEEEEGRLQRLTELRARGEKLNVDILRGSEQGRIQELSQQIQTAKSAMQPVDTEIKTRNDTGELVNKVLDALREAESDVVRSQLQRIEPLLQRVYGRIDPHPCFRVVRLLSEMRRGRGRLSTQLHDQLADASSSLPACVLSSSQLNALAVALFVALNLGIPRVPIDAVLLDDPLQSMDDINLLGTIDLLRRVREQRQLVISTHDSRFAKLLARKLRPVRPGQRTVVVSLSNWGRGGPEVRHGEVPSQPEHLRLVG